MNKLEHYEKYKIKIFYNNRAKFDFSDLLKCVNAMY